MFDMLTRTELGQLHTTLFNGATRIHCRMLDRDGHAIISVFGDDWQILHAAYAEIHEAMITVYAEIQRRDQEAIHA